YKNA
ncbi:hypothetical protein TIFTF001_041960, partial [Ficus carica]